MIKPEDLRIGDLVMVSNDNCMIPKGALCEVVAHFFLLLFEF
jgi:hypothetical protein